MGLCSHDHFFLELLIAKMPVSVTRLVLLLCERLEGIRVDEVEVTDMLEMVGFKSRTFRDAPDEVGERFLALHLRRQRRSGERDVADDLRSAFNGFPLFIHIPAVVSVILGQEDEARAEIHRFTDVVSYEEHGHFVLFPQLKQEDLDAFARGRVESPERLIHEDDAGTRDERLCDRNALLLSARELIRILVRVLGELNGVQILHRLRAELFLVHHSIPNRILEFKSDQDVFENGKMRIHAVFLRNEATGRIRKLDRLAVDVDRPLVSKICTEADIEQGGLSASGRTDECHEFARLYPQVNVLKHRHRQSGFRIREAAIEAFDEELVGRGRQ